MNDTMLHDQSDGMDSQSRSSKNMGQVSKRQPISKSLMGKYSVRAALNRIQARRTFLPLPDFVLSSLGGDVRRVVLVANNKHLTQADFELVSTRDLVIHFNDADHFDSLLSRSNYHVVFFRVFEHWKTKEGLHCGPDFRAAYAQKHYSPNAHVGFMYAKFIPDGCDQPDVVHSIILDPHPLLADYPRLPVYGSGPSTGFMMYKLLERLQRTRRLNFRKPKFDIVTLGFADVADGYFWEGHNWSFERGYLKDRLPKATFGAAARRTVDALWTTIGSLVGPSTPQDKTQPDP